MGRVRSGMHAEVFAGDMATVYEVTAELGLKLEMRKAAD